MVLLEFKRQVLPAVERASQAQIERARAQAGQPRPRPATAEVMRELDGMRLEVAELQEVVAQLNRAQRQQTEALRQLAELKRQANASRAAMPLQNFKREVDALLTAGDVDQALRMASAINAQQPLPDAVGYVLNAVVPQASPERIEQYFANPPKPITDETKLLVSFRCSTQLNAIEDRELLLKSVWVRELVNLAAVNPTAAEPRVVVQMTSVLEQLQSAQPFLNKLQALPGHTADKIRDDLRTCQRQLNLVRRFHPSVGVR